MHCSPLIIDISLLCNVPCEFSSSFDMCCLPTDEKEKSCIKITFVIVMSFL